MIPLESCVAVLLCAGLSRRFGPTNKLLASFEGKPLAAHAALCLAELPFVGRIAVVPPDEPELAALLDGYGFELVTNPSPQAGKESSLRLGLAQAMQQRARGILMALGDMPHLASAHLFALAAAATDERAAISHADGIASPPTIFPTAVARRALHRVDQTVRDSLGEPVHVTAPAAMLVDYDTREQLRKQGPAIT